MQKHKKYLIITIWISTIAFIAAGMVGWGAYNFSSSTNSVAKVGNLDITANDLNLEYNNIIRNYERSSGLTLDNEQAKALGIENMAMQMLINKALLENFALDSGIRISDDEVFKEISNIKDFQKNDIFDAELYKEILKQNRIKPLDFEERTRKDLLIQKILSLFPSIITPLEKEILNLTINLQDKLSVQIIPARSVKVNITDDALKEHYEKNKDKYKSPKRFEIKLISHKISDVKIEQESLQKYYDDNLQNYTQNGVREELEAIKDRVIDDFRQWRAKRDALESSIALRDDKVDGEVLTIDETSHPVIIEAITKAKNQKRIEPILDDEKYLAVKILREIPQEFLPFESAKNSVYADIYPTALREAMIKEAKSRQNVFLGKDIGFYSFSDNKPILSLNAVESQQALQEIFSKSDKNGFVVFGDKVLLYNVLEQKMLDSTLDLQIYNDFKSRILEQTVFDFLAKKYKVVNHIRG